MPADTSATPGQVLDQILAPMLAGQAEKQTRIRELHASLEEMQKEFESLKAQLDDDSAVMADAVRTAAHKDPVLAAIFGVTAGATAAPSKAPSKSVSTKNPDAPGADPEPSDAIAPSPAPAGAPAPKAEAPARATSPDAPKPAAKADAPKPATATPDAALPAAKSA